MTKVDKEKNIQEIEKEIDTLSATNPEDEYKKKVEEEDPEKLEEARKKLMLMINIKCKGIGIPTIQGKIKPMVYQMNIADCENMTQKIKKKGMYGLPIALKTHTKYVEKR